MWLRVFDVAIWGTVSDWTGALLTGLSVFGAAVVYAFDRRRERRSQASSVLVWLHPHEHGPPLLKMLNLSDKPVFDHGFVMTSRSKRRIRKLANDGWKQNRMFEWPPGDRFKLHDRRTLLDFHDGSELHLGKDQQGEFQPTLEYNSVVYDYYGSFRDASGKYWAVDARTQRLVSAWKRWRLGIGPAGLDAT